MLRNLSRKASSCTYANTKIGLLLHLSCALYRVSNQDVCYNVKMSKRIQRGLRSHNRGFSSPLLLFYLEFVDLYRTCWEDMEEAKHIYQHIKLEGGKYKRLSQARIFFEVEKLKLAELVGKCSNIQNNFVYLGKTELTQDVYELVMGENPSYFEDSESVDFEDLESGARPVESISVRDAMLFCNRLSELLGFDKCYSEPIDKNVECSFNANGYRLPTVEEWELAAEVHEPDSIWPNGVYDEAELLDIAWYSENSEDSTHAVGEKDPDVFGFCDLAGNVWEMCYNPDTKSCALKGGAYDSDTYELEIKHTGGISYLAEEGDDSDPFSYKGPNIGFRIIKSIPIEFMVILALKPF